MSARDDRGLALDENFDLEPDESGDWAIIHGTDELEKDLASQMSVLFNNRDVGASLDPNEQARISKAIETTVMYDPRVITVYNIDLSYDGKSGTMSATVEIESIYGDTVVSE